MMEKYAVVQEKDTKDKTASAKPTCPKCGKELIDNDQYLMFCNTCGTEPWEKRNK